MWMPWSAAAGWGRARQATALENARTAAVACSRAQAERIEIELFVAEVNAERLARRDRPAITA